MSSIVVTGEWGRLTRVAVPDTCSKPMARPKWLRLESCLHLGGLTDNASEDSGRHRLREEIGSMECGGRIST